MKITLSKKSELAKTIGYGLTRWTALRLEHVELIRVNRPLHNVLAQPVGAGDEHHVREAGLGIETEDHPACRKV